MAREDTHKQLYSNKEVSVTLMEEVKQAIKGVKDFGSVEIYVSGGVVTQITVRNIKKTNGFIDNKPDKTRFKNDGLGLT